MEHNKLNRIIAAIIFVIALIVYGRTVAPTTSYWDCGEFITCAYMLGVPHPPGAPLYILVGRIFTMLPFFDDIGLRVNILSVILSAFTVMFTYLIIVRLLREWRGVPETIEQKIIMYTGGVIGALAFAFSDSFWFNAVEAEVYAVAMFFTAIVVWLILVWSEKAETPASDRIILLIVYLMGLATGAHLLNVLALFTIGLIIYFKRTEFNLSSFAIAAVAMVVAFGAIYPGIVKGIPWVLDFSFVALAGLVLVILLGIYYAIKNQQRIMSLILMSILLMMVGYSTYTAIYIRSGLQPAINENNPNVPARLVSYLNREQYGDIPLTERRAPMWEYQIKKMYIRYLGWQFIGKGETIGQDNYIVETISTHGLMGLPFLVGLIGMFYHFNRDWKRALSILALFIMTGVAIAIYLNQEDPQPRERDYAYVASFFAFALWIGIGASAVMELVYTSFTRSMALRKIAVGLTIVLLVVAVPYKMIAFNYDEHDRTGNFVAYDYSYNILQTCEPDAILFTNGDNDTFPLWFLQYVYNIRRDVRVVNLSLLNTDWYIKQLRDEEPKVPITYNDKEIEELQAILWPEPKRLRIDVPREKVLEHLQKGEDNAVLKLENVPEKPAIAFEMTNTKSITGHPVILVQDRMVLHIIAANRFVKPIYFAVTVSPENMLNLDNRRRDKGHDNYLRMDGLAFRVMPYGGSQDFISPEKLHVNLFEKFQYRNLDNPNVFYNDNILGLLQNYRSAFLRLTNHYQTMGLSDSSANEKALAVLDKMNEAMPEEIVPLRNYQLSIQFGRMYADAGRPEELRRRLEQVPKVYHLEPIDKLYLAEFYAQFLRDSAKAESLAVAVMNEAPETNQVYGWLVGHYTRTQQYKKSTEVLEKWLQRYPADREAKAELARVQKLSQVEDSLKTSNQPADGAPTSKP